MLNRCDPIIVKVSHFDLIYRKDHIFLFLN